MAYRDNLRIIFDIMQSIQKTQDCNISQIARFANIAHYSLDERLQIMKQSDLVVEHIGSTSQLSRGSNSKRIFTLTHKGQQFLQKLLQLFTELDSMGIRTN